MAALARYAEGPESWDDDPDLDLPSGPLLHMSHADPSLTLQPPSDSEPASPAVDHDFDDDADGSFERVAGDWEDSPRTREEENESSVDSSRTSTTTGTLKGLMEGLSLDREADTTVSFDSAPPSSSPPCDSFEPDATPRMSKTTTLRGSSPLSVLLAASRSPSGRGKVHHLGSTPQGHAQPVDDGDWDHDLEGLDALQLGGTGPDAAQRVVAKKGSFASHISLDDDDDDGMSAFNEPAEHVARKRISIASFTDAEDNGDGEDDFELPSTLSHISLAPSLVNRPSNVSLRSDISSATQPGQLPHTPATPGLAVPALQNPAYTTTPSAPSSPGPLTPSRSSDDDGPSSSALDDDDDADFFEDLVLPSYFLAGNGAAEAKHKPAATPPTSDGEPDSDAPAAKVDLQSILRAKLEARGGRGLLFHAPEPGAAALSTSPQEQKRLERHREKYDEGDEADLARELRRSSISGPATAEVKDEEWSAREMRERMRTISGARAKEAQQAREAREAKRAACRIGVLRRTASDGKVPPVPGRRGLPSMPARASTTAPLAARSSLPLSSGTGSSGGKSSIPQPVRPASAHGTERPPSAASSHSNESGSMRRRGPPPAPSAASRGRSRMRTTSLRAAPSIPDLRAASRSRSVNLDLPTAPSSSSKRSLSPISMTPGTPTSAVRPSLRAKRSQQHLSAAAVASATSTRTIERKRSLQSLSALASPTPSAPPPPSSAARPRSRQNSLRSASPGGRLPSFAAPTAASASRIRERVQSNPAPYIPPSPTPTTQSPFASISSSRPPPTPSSSSSLSERLLRPTLASASKTRTLPRPASPQKPALSHSPRLPSTAQSAFLSGIRLPSAAQVLSRPLGAGRTPAKGSYGDGTELDAFDDLPVSKERERERVVPPASSRKSSGASTTTLKGGSWGRKEGSRLAQRAPPAAGEKPGTVLGRKEGTAERATAKGKEREKEKKAGDPEKKRLKKRREPHLIRHLGGASAVKVQGEMTYNPVLQRWEGNEAILREFDKALATSTRPALISPFSSTIGSPHRGSFLPGGSATQCAAAPAAVAIPKVALPPGATPSASRGTAKVVGDMVFDPATCTWHAVAGPDAEDELELDWGGGGTSGGEAADDDDSAAGGLGAPSEVDGWELGERERMLKGRASFVLEEGSDEDAEEAINDGATRRAHTTKKQIWRESRAAEERSRAELRAWRTHESEDGEGRKWLWELRALVLDIS